ncbi:MAG: divergent polysaccharide deacetylase family protein [Alphaproteobacteria bacterium]|nr:divergent polysaccharide deacetylase family protein [Alphaproteobacteria bacterium]
MKKKTKKRLRLWGLILLLCLVAGFVLWRFAGALHKSRAPTHWHALVTKIDIREAPPVISKLLPDSQSLSHLLDIIAKQMSGLWQGSPYSLDEQAKLASLYPPAVRPPLKKGAVAVIIDDMGLSQQGSQRALRLPEAVTLSYLPYAPNLAAQTQAARQAGHDLLLHMPMEPLASQKTRSDALMVADDAASLKAKLEKAFSSFQGYEGINNHMGSRFTLDQDGMAIVARTLKEHGLFFVDSRTHGKSLGAALAAMHGVKAASRDVFIDDVLEASAIRSELKRAEKIAAARGSVILIGHPHLLTLDMLEQWFPTFPAKGLYLVPVKELVQ